MLAKNDSGVEDPAGARPKRAITELGVLVSNEDAHISSLTAND
jgi:hypothetical protein